MSVRQVVRIDLYRLIADAVERGIAYGWSRAYKHTDTPEPDSVKQDIEDAVMNELCEFIQFDEH